MTISLLQNDECKSDGSLKIRKSACGSDPEVFTRFYDEETNIVIWQRDLSLKLQDFVKSFLIKNPHFQLSMTVSPDRAYDSLLNELGGEASSELCSDIAELVDMFCCLFEIKSAGLRLTALNKAMCPKFHVDRVPGRLVTTYQGVATEWLPHKVINRRKLGTGSNGLPDHESGLYQDETDIQQLGCGDVSLLKGELWDGNENAGLVHRSPNVVDGESRLLFTLDFIH